jgi:CheY-like chemotaxis protein
MCRVIGSNLETGWRAVTGAAASSVPGLDPGLPPLFNFLPDETMKSALYDGMPDDVLIVEDDPIIALDLEDTILGFGVKAVRSAGNVARALELIAERAPDFALLDVGLIREKSFAIAARLDQLQVPFAFITGYGADIRIAAAFADRPRLPKPYSTDALKALLRSRAGGVVKR